MLNHTKKWIIAISLMLISASALAVDEGSQALMIIRFNQEHVAYAQALYTTLSRALEVRPSAHFTLVCVAPKASDPEEQKRQDARALHNLDEVESTLKEIGMPEDRFTTQKTHADVSSSEVHIYVE